MPWRPDYVTPEELAVFVHTDVEEERAELEGACASGSRAIDTATYRQFGSVAAQARIYTPQWSTKLGMWTIECDDFTALTVLEIDVHYATWLDFRSVREPGSTADSICNVEKYKGLP